MKSVTDIIANAVFSSGLNPFHPYGYARTALEVDYQTVVGMNKEMRSLVADWEDNNWIIGHDGTGNYFTVTKGRPNPCVDFWDHETNETRKEFDSIEAFISDALEIERENQKQAEPSSGSNS